MKKFLPDQERTILWGGAVPIAEESRKGDHVDHAIYTFLPGTLVPLSVQTSQDYFTIHVDPVGTVDVVWNERGERSVAVEW